MSSSAPAIQHRWHAPTCPAAVAGTTVGAGILALPAVTAESGFAASAAALTGFALFSITTGLLVAEVNLNTLCELGASRGVSLR